MKIRKSIAPVAASALLVLATLGTGARADSVIEVDDDLAHEVQEKIQRMPPVSGGSSNTVTVEAWNGVLRLSGFVESFQERRAINDVIKSVEGLHMDQIDDHIVQNLARHGRRGALGGRVVAACPPRAALV